MSRFLLLRAVLCGGFLFIGNVAFAQSWRYSQSPTKSAAKSPAKAAPAPATAAPPSAYPAYPTYPATPYGTAAAPPAYVGFPPAATAPTYVPAPTTTELPLVGPTGAPPYVAAFGVARLPPPAEPLPAPGYRYVAGEPAPVPQPAPQAAPLSIDGQSALAGDCAPDCCPPKACWVIGADLLGMTRTRAGDQPILASCEDGCSAMDVHDMNFGYELGLRVTALRLPGACGGCGWEIGYLGMPNWSTVDAAAGDLIVLGPGFTLEVDPSQFVATYQSSLHSIELNARPCQASLCGATASWFVGFRYLRLDETFTLDEYVAPIANVLDVNTQNNLYGGQMGANVLLCDRGGPFYLESTVKFGLFGNDASQTTASSLVGPAVGANGTQLAFVGEFQFAAGYRVSQCFDVRVGYQVLGVSGVALAPDQLNVSDLSTGYASIDYGNLLMHGAFIGGSFRW